MNDLEKRNQIFTLLNPVNVYLAEYFFRKGNPILKEYLDNKLDDYVKTSEITAENILQEMKIMANDGGLTADEIYEAAMRELTLLEDLTIHGENENE
jgi:hypothetical protein